MVSLSTLFRYVGSRVEFATAISSKGYRQGQIAETQFFDTAWKHFFQGKLTYMHRHNGEEMAPTIGAQAETLLVRKLPISDPTRVFVGDVVVLKDPQNADNFLVRRLAAIEGYEMVSTDEKDEPFVLEKDECWVVADNENIKPKEANDSRSFGPVSMSNIVGRVIYCLRSLVNHGPVNNSHFSTQKDSAILEFELDVEEMASYHKGR